MKIELFEYTKEDGEKTNREVMILHSNKEYIDSIDFGHLISEEIETVRSIQKDYEEKMKPYMNKAFRRFSKNRMAIIEFKD